MKTWLITGSSSGVGRAISKFLLAQGDLVIAPIRDLEKPGVLVHENYKPIKADLSLVFEQFAFLEKLKSCAYIFDGAIFSAGILDLFGDRTKEGLHQMEAVNFLSAITLAKDGRDLFKNDALLIPIGGSPFILKSARYNASYPMAVGLAGLAQSVVGKALALMGFLERLETKKMRLAILHPGIVRSNLGANFKAGLFDFLRGLIMFFSPKRCTSFERFYAETILAEHGLWNGRRFVEFHVHDSMPKPDEMLEIAMRLQEKALSREN